MSVRLEQLLAAATPGKWVFDGSEMFADEGNGVGPLLMASEADCLLAALSKDMARLLIDMGEALLWTDNSLTHVLSGRTHRAIAEVHAANEALLARLDALGNDTS